MPIAILAPSGRPPAPFGLSLSKACSFPSGKRRPDRLILSLLCLLLAMLALMPSAWAQTFPAFDDKGVVDAANILDPAQEQALSAKLIAQKKASGRALFVATIPDLQGYDVRDYGYRLGRAWGIGDKTSNGALLIIALTDRKIGIEAGYGLEGVLTDAVSSQIIRNAISPRFKAGDMAGGINAGVDEITTLLALPPDEAKQRAAAAEAATRKQDDSGGIIAFWIILFIVFFVALPLLSRAKGGKRYRRGGGSGPIIIWGPGAGSDWGGSGWGSGGGGSSWGGGDSGGGFSGGGSFGGGGASGDW